MSPEQIETENNALRESWEKLGAEHLDSYLISDVEDPRINCQSILTRALLADSLWPNEFNDLIDAELRFGAVMCWLLKQLKEERDRTELLNAIIDPVDSAMPPAIPETWRWLQTDSCPVPDYISNALMSVNWGAPDKLLFEPALDTFCTIWRSELEGRSAEPITLLEPACGSANDYRFIYSYGLADHIRYTGFDLVKANIVNSKANFPELEWRVASVFDSGLPDQSYDYVFVHDLFEHLSPEGLERALAEVMRMTRYQAWLHFFSASEAERHHFQRAESYYLNKLSMPRLIETLQGLGAEVEVTRMTDLLKNKFGYEHYHNPDAVTILATRKE